MSIIHGLACFLSMEEKKLTLESDDIFPRTCLVPGCIVAYYGPCGTTVDSSDKKLTVSRVI